MTSAELKLIEAKRGAAARPPREPIGRHLVESGAIGSDQLVRALELQERWNAPLGEILCAQGWTDTGRVQEALAHQHGVTRIDLAEDPPDVSLAGLRPPDFWLRHQVVPWMRLGETLVLATARPDRMEEVRAALGSSGPVLAVLADKDQIREAISRLCAEPLAASASNRVEPRFSCRSWRAPSRIILPTMAVGAGGVLGASLMSPATLIAGLSLLAVATLLLIAALKAAGFAAKVFDLRAMPDSPLPSRLPKVSVLVPLYREREIADVLVRRLRAITYPKALLDVILVLEERDKVTAETVAATDLPHWIRVLRVPAHEGLTTKPRAMNYALDFCDGEIIGVWDAEDAPDPDQIERVVARFAASPAKVACLQGILDYYNPRANWLARCFTIEYASWFRMVLPGMARLGLVIPLGGTTMFIRRNVLQELGGWDAHNVTEDADLGVRLARFGYETELIETVTREEANCRLWPWIRQRSRWLKGFMVTYLVHMRDPRRLWRELGPRRFLGFQAFFIGTCSQFLLAPVLWSFWLIALGVHHPVTEYLPEGMRPWLLGLFLFSAAVNITIGFAAVARESHRHLLGWVPTLILYYPLGCIASYKALYELVRDPFYWDKTQHGRSGPDRITPCPGVGPRPVRGGS